MTQSENLLKKVLVIDAKAMSGVSDETAAKELLTFWVDYGGQVIDALRVLIEVESEIKKLKN